MEADPATDITVTDVTETADPAVVTTAVVADPAAVSPLANQGGGLVPLAPVLPVEEETTHRLDQTVTSGTAQATAGVCHERQNHLKD